MTREPLLSPYWVDRIQKQYSGEWDYKKEYKKEWNRNYWQFVKENPMLYALEKERWREYHKEYDKEYDKTPKRREYRREYSKTPKQRKYYREYTREYRKITKWKEYKKEYNRNYCLRKKIFQTFPRQ